MLTSEEKAKNKRRQKKETARRGKVERKDIINEKESKKFFNAGEDKC